MFATILAKCRSKYKQTRKMKHVIETWKHIQKISELDVKETKLQH